MSTASTPHWRSNRRAWFWTMALKNQASMLAPATVRSWQPGDRIRTPGGTKSLQDLFTDRKVPREERPRVPVVEADGEVVYLFDPDSRHGDESFPFKAIRLRNPTDSVLESGPVTVFSAGRFIGEGLVEPIPACP